MKVGGNKMQNCRATWTTNFTIGIGMFLSLLHCFRPASAVYEPDRIIGLPGLNFSLNFAHFSGYLDVSADRHLFYWFVTSQNNPSTDPLLFWFNGGPGSSSLYGMLTEIGPYLVNETGKKLEKNNFAWNRNASIVAIEAPAGVGFSYNTTQYIWSDDNTSADNYAAIKQFFVKFPEFRNNSMFVTGESYAGVYVPTLVERILDGQRSYPINLQGMAIGNAQLNDTLDVITQMQWGYYHGFIDEVEFKQLQMSCKYNIDDCNRTVVQNFWLQHAAVPWWQLDQYDVMQACVDVQTIGSNNQTVTTLRCENAFYDGAVGVYLNQTKVRQALHVADAVMNKNWTVDNDTIFNAFVRTHGVGDRFADLNRAVNRTMETIFKRIIDAGIRTMLYYGDTDSFTNFLLGQKFAANLGYDQTTETKMAWSHLGQNAGMVTGYGNLTYTTVRGASHMVTQKRPAQILQAINAFMNNQELGPLSN